VYLPSHDPESKARLEERCVFAAVEDRGAVAA